MFEDIENELPMREEKELHIIPETPTRPSRSRAKSTSIIHDSRSKTKLSSHKKKTLPRSSIKIIPMLSPAPDETLPMGLIDTHELEDDSTMTNSFGSLQTTDLSCKFDLAASPDSLSGGAHTTITSTSAFASGEVVPMTVGDDNDDTDDEDTSINRLGISIYKGHRGYFLMRCVQMGIRYVVGGVESKPHLKILMESDFKKRVKLEFPAEGSERTPAHDFTNFQFKDYAPHIFRSLRDMSGIDPSEYMVSLCGSDSLSMLGTPGKSGALFFFSQNMKFIIKTVTKKEALFLKHILPDYHLHIRSNPNTLLTKFFGLHKIKPVGGRVVRFIVMNNVFMTHLKIHERYDLKGSTVDRSVTEEERKKPNPIYKDLDIKFFVHLGKEKTIKVKEQMALDCKFLEENSIMDYSLLLGVHYANYPEEDLTDMSCDNCSSASERIFQRRRMSLPSTLSSQELSHKSKKWLDRRKRKQKTDSINLYQQDFGGCLSVEPDAGKVYFFGIIDILQKWNTRKQMERFLKSFKYEKTDISVAHPQQYAKRFMAFMNNLFREE